MIKIARIIKDGKISSASQKHDALTSNAERDDERGEQHVVRGKMRGKTNNEGGNRCARKVVRDRGKKGTREEWGRGESSRSLSIWRSGWGCAEVVGEKHVAGGDVALKSVRDGDLICGSKDRRQMDTVEAKEKGGRKGEWGEEERKVGRLEIGEPGDLVEMARGSQRERITIRR
jgi:hypothetical protein